MERKTGTKKQVVLMVYDEAVRRSLSNALAERGYAVRRDIESGKGSAMGFVCSYFTILGAANQLHAVNASLPIVLIDDGRYRLNGHAAAAKFFDALKVGGCGDEEIRRKVDEWFGEGQGRFLGEARGEGNDNEKGGN